MTTFATEPVVLPGAEVLQAAFELAGVRGEELLPAGLAPTRPTLLTFVVIRVAESPIGPLTYAQARLSCRSGARARALVVATAVDAPPATVAALRDGWGIAGDRGGLAFDRRYDRIVVTVPAWELELTVRGLQPIDAGSIQYVVGLQPVATDDGARLAQVELDVEPQRAERGCPGVSAPSGIVDQRIQPRHAVAATLAVGSLTLPRVRFLLHPDLAPHLGTEVL